MVQRIQPTVAAAPKTMPVIAIQFRPSLTIPIAPKIIAPIPSQPVTNPMNASISETIESGFNFAIFNHICFVVYSGELEYHLSNVSSAIWEIRVRLPASDASGKI